MNHLGPIDAFNHVWRDEADNNLIIRLGKSLNAGFVGLIWGYSVTEVEAQEYLLRQEKSDCPNRPVHSYFISSVSVTGDFTLTADFTEYKHCLQVPFLLECRNYPPHLTTVMDAFSPAMKARISIKKDEEICHSLVGDKVVVRTNYQILIDERMYASHSSGYQHSSVDNEDDGLDQVDRQALADTLASLSALQKAMDSVPEEDQGRVAIYKNDSGRYNVELDGRTYDDRPFEIKKAALRILATVGRECELLRHPVLQDRITIKRHGSYYETRMDNLVCVSGQDFSKREDVLDFLQEWASLLSDCFGTDDQRLISIEKKGLEYRVLLKGKLLHELSSLHDALEYIRSDLSRYEFV